MAFSIPIEGLLPSKEDDPSDEECIDIKETGSTTVSGEEVIMEKAGAQIVQGEDVRMHQSGCQIIRAKRVFMEEAGAGVIVAQKVEGKQISCGILMAREVKGDVRAVLTPQAAVGLAAGLVIALSIKRALFSRD